MKIYNIFKPRKLSCRLILTASICMLIMLAISAGAIASYMALIVPSTYEVVDKEAGGGGGGGGGNQGSGNNSEPESPLSSWDIVSLHIIPLTDNSLAVGYDKLYMAVGKEAIGTMGVVEAIWSSNNPKVAVIAENTGLIRGISEGVAVITASNSGLQSSIDVRVVPVLTASPATVDWGKIAKGSSVTRPIVIASSSSRDIEVSVNASLPAGLILSNVIKEIPASSNTTFDLILSVDVVVPKGPGNFNINFNVEDLKITPGKAILSVYRGEERQVIGFDTDKAALVLMDMWSDIHHLQQNMDNINDMIQAFRGSGGLVIQSFNTCLPAKKLNKSEYDIVVPLSLPGYEMLMRKLKENDITYVFYAGYYSDQCLVVRDTGIEAVADGGYKNRIIVVRDATAACFIDDEESIANIEDKWGFSTSIDELISALED